MSPARSEPRKYGTRRTITGRARKKQKTPRNLRIRKTRRSGSPLPKRRRKVGTRRKMTTLTQATVKGTARKVKKKAMPSLWMRNLTRKQARP